MNKEKCEKVERSVKGTTNKDVRKNLDRWISVVSPQAQTQQQVQTTRGPSVGKHSPHSIRIWYKHNETEDQILHWNNQKEPCEELLKPLVKN